MLKIGFISLGCPKNLADTETMMGQVQKSHLIVSDMESADIMIINTCSFIAIAKDETIENLRDLSKWKKSGKKIIVTGCFSEEFKEEIFKMYPKVDAVICTGVHNAINLLITRLMNGEKKVFIDNDCKDYFSGNEERLLSTPLHYAYLKIGDGCDNCCSYCKIPSFRGKAVYKSPGKIMSEARNLAERGVKELILIAQDTSAYNWKDNYFLSNLLQELENIEKIEWIRLLYLYPDKISEELINTMVKSKKVVKYLDMPIQHINDKILSNMNRKSSRKVILEKIKQVKQMLPEVKLRTSVITGFPGETEKEFFELYDFIEDTKFDHLGVFAYSNEADTASFRMKGQSTEEVKSLRLHKLMSLQRRISKKLNENYKGQKVSVLVDNMNGGRRYFDAPQIDGFVKITNNKPEHIGTIKKVLIKKSLAYDLIGEII